MIVRNRSFGRNITVLSIFLAFMGMGVVDPILPDIALKLGANHWQVEMLFSAYIFMMAFMMLPAGVLAVKFGDKRVMATGLGLVALFATLCSFATSIVDLSLYRAGWGFSNALFFATALIILIALSNEYHKAVGLFEGAIGFGISAGPLLGGFLGEHSWRFPFLATGILSLCAFIAVLFFVKVPNDNKRKSVKLEDLKALFTNRKFILISFSAMLYFYGFIVILAYSPLVVNLNPIEMGLLFFGWGLALACGSIVISTKLESFYEVKQIIPVTILIFALILFIIMNVESKALMSMLIILSGLLSGINNSVLTSYVMELNFEKNIISGGFNFLRWMGAGTAPILSGFIAGKFNNMHLPFLVAAILSIISFLLLFSLRKAK
ncbi:MFS transporter [Halarcobacter ebronensis]|uniref:MFS transporter n=1 Tax=Halarcobacter ebronensis TaxID=1462615 RepID=A0A4Q0YHM4_9BACT|nr:MFS transporter [Halarcobacter ebronensis]